MRHFRFSSWRFMLVMFVLISIIYSDLTYYEDEALRTQNPENTISSGTPDQDHTKDIDMP